MKVIPIPTPKPILIPIPPEHVVRILNGEMTVLTRKTAPKCDLPTTVYVYCAESKSFELDEDEDGFFLHNIYIPDKEPREHYFQGKVVAKFVLRKIEPIYIQNRSHTLSDKHDWEAVTNTLSEIELRKKSCIPDEGDLWDYLINGNGYAWHVSDLEVLDGPRKLSEFGIERAPRSWRYAKTEERSGGREGGA